jgi:hypothetical protein
VLIPIPHLQWQVLRAALRAEAAGEHALGRALRLAPTRNTKDGTFLDDLVAEGLLVRVGKPVPAPPLRDEPEPFRVRYKLTDLGRYAAEYGEYDRPHTPRDAPVTGLAAEIREAFGARRPWGDGKPAPKKGRKTR